MTERASSTPAPRIQPVDPDDPQLDPRTRERLDQVARHLGHLGPVHPVLARNPAVYRGWLTLGSQLMLRSSLSAAQRELVILRTAALADCSYEWHSHLDAARRAGLTETDLRAIRSDDHDGLPTDRRLLLDATTEIVRRYHVSDELWTQLASEFDPAQLVEIPILVGHYVMTAGAIRSLGIDVDATTRRT